MPPIDSSGAPATALARAPFAAHGCRRAALIPDDRAPGEARLTFLRAL